MSSVPVNPTCTQLGSQAAIVSIPVDSMNNMNGQVTKSHHLLVRVTNVASNSDSENTGWLNILCNYYLITYLLFKLFKFLFVL